MTETEYTKLLRHKLPIGRLSEEDMDTLFKYSIGKQLAIELGTFFGRGALILSLGAKEVHTFDVFERCEMIENEIQREIYLDLYNKEPHSFADILSSLFYRNNVSIYNELSFNAASLYKTSSVDLIFIDADHSYEGVKKDFDVWFDKIKSGGIIIFHDYQECHKPICDFIDFEIKTNKRMQFNELCGSCSVWTKI